MKKLIYLLVALAVFCGSFVISTMLKERNKYEFSAQSVGGKVNMHSFDGKYKIFYFGYNFCPDVCPMTLTLLSSVLNEKIKRDDILVVFITLDPQRDSPKIADDFVKYFYPNSVGLVADNLDKMAQNFGVKYQKIDLNDSQMKYSVAHSSALYLFNKKGKFVKTITNLTYEEIENSIKELIKD